MSYLKIISLVPRMLRQIIHLIPGNAKREMFLQYRQYIALCVSSS